ncbi:hypothetical protein BKA61DRAFT_617573, partial [Leptodontidium sp. MPI-SDFR-AT-0119]
MHGSLFVWLAGLRDTVLICDLVMVIEVWGWIWLWLFEYCEFLRSVLSGSITKLDRVCKSLFLARKDLRETGERMLRNSADMRGKGTTYVGKI